MRDRRIAEFDSADDAWAFRNMKGKDDYDVCGGINMMYAVMPKIQYETDFTSDSPPEARSLPYRDGDDE